MYSRAGDLIASVNPTGGRETTAYTSFHLPKEWTTLKGDTIKLTYDAQGQISEKAYPSGLKFAYTYNALGLMTSASDERGLTTWDYDDAGRLLRRTEPDGVSISYRYNAEGRLVELSTPAGVTRYSYNQQNLLASVTAPDGGVTNYVYSALGELIEIRQPNGLIQSLTLDANGLLSKQLVTDGSGNLVDSIEYIRDATGRKLGFNDFSGRQCVTTTTYWID